MAIGSDAYAITRPLEKGMFSDTESLRYSNALREMRPSTPQIKRRRRESIGERGIKRMKECLNRGEPEGRERDVAHDDDAVGLAPEPEHDARMNWDARRRPHDMQQELRNADWMKLERSMR